MARIYDENRDNILGLRIRQSEELAEGLGIEPLKATVTIAEKIGCPVEVHCTNIPVPTCEVLNLLRPGDIFEHVYQGVKNTIIDENGRLYDCVREARKRGILFDTAEGRKHGDFDVMRKAKEQGFIADFCSTDLVLASTYRRPIFSPIRISIPLRGHGDSPCEGGGDGGQRSREAYEDGGADRLLKRGSQSRCGDL